MSRQVEELIFRAREPDVLLGRMAELAESRSGWVNLQPGIHPEDEPPASSGLLDLFEPHAAEIPICTWVPGRSKRRKTLPDTIGVQHASGTKVVARLDFLGVGMPSGWRWVQDHPRRGLVILLPQGASLQRVVDWLFSAAEALSPVELTGEWRALIHTSGKRARGVPKGKAL
ncbi:MAG: hypothetical protein M1115_01505 [Actinobacteria bacterium]|nr:hypothetical protein [Actinomycetota bacterium]